MMNKTVVLVAGGSGLRMGSVLPKQFMLLQGKPVFIYTIEAFIKAYPSISVVLVLPDSYIEHAKQCLNDFQITSENVKIVPGGKTRFESVKNGLVTVPNNQIVFIHDAVRCLVSIELIKRCAETCMDKGSAIPVLPLKDSIREVISDRSSRPLDRSTIRIVQTPQTFLSDNLKEAFKLNYQESFTDEATVLEAAGFKVTLVEGDEKNIKITYPADIDFASWKLSKL
jgi:2-C-methyl-D-erythritol 4-phosphate cytidylyltransferase